MREHLSTKCPLIHIVSSSRRITFASFNGLAPPHSPSTEGRHRKPLSVSDGRDTNDQHSGVSDRWLFIRRRALLCPLKRGEGKTRKTQLTASIMTRENASELEMGFSTSRKQFNSKGSIKGRNLTNSMLCGATSPEIEAQLDSTASYSVSI